MGARNGTFANKHSVVWGLVSPGVEKGAVAEELEPWGDEEMTTSSPGLSLEEGLEGLVHGLLISRSSQICTFWEGRSLLGFFTMSGKEVDGARSLLWAIFSIGPGLEKVSNELIFSLKDRLAVEEVDLKLGPKGLVRPNVGFCWVGLGSSL